jgi:hypothetical protein
MAVDEVKLHEFVGKMIGDMGDFRCADARR